MLHPGLCSSVGMRSRTDRRTHRQTHTHRDARDHNTFRVVYDRLTRNVISEMPQAYSALLCHILLWPPNVIGETIIFLARGFFCLSIYLFSSLNLSHRRLDVYHTSTHGVALV